MTQDFFELCGAVLLSEAVETESITENLQDLPTVQMYLHEVMPYLQRHLYCNHFEHYKKISTIMCEKLKVWKCRSVSIL